MVTIVALHLDLIKALEADRDAARAEVERLKTEIELQSRDPEHANCRNVEAQLTRQVQVECEGYEKLRASVRERERAAAQYVIEVVASNYSVDQPELEAELDRRYPRETEEPKP